MSQILVESELMKNQKAAALLPAQSAFASHQTQSGASIFLAISEAGVLNVILEQNTLSSGWKAFDMCGGLSALHQHAAITVTSFNSEQNYTDGSLTIATVVKAAGDNNSYLYVATGLPNTDTAAWLTSFAAINWSARPYDDATHPLSTVTIANVYLTPQQKTSSDVQLIAEVNINNSLQNYTVNLAGNNAWAQLQTATNFKTLLDTAIGKAAASNFAGIYQLTNINGSVGLTFVPLQSFFGPPTVINLVAATGATKIATLTADDQNNTNLFVAAAGAVYLFTPSQQKNNTAGLAIIQHALITELQDFYAHQTATTTVLYWLNQQGQVCYTKCAKGQEGVSTAWSAPVPIFTGTERMSSYIDQQNDGITIFAHTSDQQITQLSQDVTNTLWQQRSILLPAPDVNTVVEYNTYTSHIALTDDNNLPLANVTANITSVNDCSVYINDTYYRLSPTVPLPVTTDDTGNITIVQETQNLSAVCYKVTLSDTNLPVNPMSKLVTTVSGIKTATDLSNVQVDNGDGTTKPLVGSTVTGPQKTATAAALQQFVSVSANLPQDGSTQSASAVKAEAFVSRAGAAAPITVWGISYDDEWTYHEGAQSMARLMARPNGTALALEARTAFDVQDFSSWIETAAGDLWNWLKHAFEEVAQFFVAVVDGVYHFLVQIGTQFYRAVIDCIHDVVHAFEFVFNKIEVFFEDLVKWLGFLFNWGDILRTHNALKNIMKTYFNYAVDQLGDAENNLKQAFNNIENFVATWANIPNTIPPNLQASTRNSNMQANGQTPGMNSPQSNWGMTQTKNNAPGSSSSAISPIGDVESLLQPLLTLLENEKEIFQNAYTAFKTSVIDKIGTLSLVDLIKAVVGIIVNTILESVENILVTAIDVFIQLVKGLVDLLDAPIQIPVISWLYNKITGSQLSLLDLSCLIIAIPTNVVYKLITEEAPFPDNATTTALINAPDFATVQKICNGTQEVEEEEFAVTTTLTAPPVPRLGAPAKTINQQLVLAAGICSAFGAVGVAVFGPLKTKFPQFKPWSILNGICYFPYVLPDIVGQIPDLQNKKWWAITNEIITDICVVKAVIDAGMGCKAVPSEGWNAFSPWFDFCANIAWQVPTEAALFDPENQNTAGILSVFAGTCFDCSGVLAPALADDSEPVSWGVLVGANAVLNAGYGAMSCAASVLTYKG